MTKTAAWTTKGILTDKRQLGPYPMEKIRHVDTPTTVITDTVERIDESETGFNRAERGDWGPVIVEERARFVMKYPLSAAEADMTAYLGQPVDGPVASQKAPIPDTPELLSRHIKRLGYFLRSDIVGICELPAYAVYKHTKDGKEVEKLHKYAIVIVVDQDYDTFHGSTGNDWISNSQSFRSYSTSAFIACIMANYIRRLGYPARAHHARNYQVAIPPLLLHAGIGEMCRIGDIVLNPFLGPRFKAAAITTDLPLHPDKPVDFGLQQFCSYCKKCARECPSKAITDREKILYNGYEVWKPDIERCTKFRCTNQNGSGCGRCIKVCPWNKPKKWYHDIVRSALMRVDVARRIMVRLDDILGYGKQDIRDRWWFDLEEIDGVLTVPTKRNKV